MHYSDSDFFDVKGWMFFFFFSRPATSFMWFTSPFKSLRYILWRRFKWKIITFLVICLVVALVVLFFYSAPVSLSHSRNKNDFSNYLLWNGWCTKENPWGTLFDSNFLAQCEHPWESCWTVLSSGAVCFVIQCHTNFLVCGSNHAVWPFFGKLLNITFMWCCLFCDTVWF